MNKQNSSEELEIINRLFTELFPICRSITGDGVRKSLQILQNLCEFDIKEIPSGTKCFDWTVPDEWNINDAFIKDANGEKIIDFKKNNLHIVNYSVPIHDEMNFKKLKTHLYTLPHLPDAIPYRTTYYKKDWGFCMKQEDYEKFKESEEYQVVIDSSLMPGNLTYGEALIKGDLSTEFVFSTYCCHPSMANDNLSGMILWLLLLRYLKSRKTKYSYRFIISPETIGTISYISQNKNNLKNVFGGFILSCVAGPNEFVYSSTFLNNHIIDKIVNDVFIKLNLKFTKKPFKPIGSDERQYSSPGFRIPIGIICKDQFHDFDYYHTSLDNLEFVNDKSLLQSYFLYVKIIENIESLDKNSIKPNQPKNSTKSKFSIYLTLNPYCEPMLSKRGLYPKLGGTLFQPSDRNENNERHIELLSTTLFYSDSNTTIEEISIKSGFSELEIEEMSEKLVTANLLKRVTQC